MCFLSGVFNSIRDKLLGRRVLHSPPPVDGYVIISTETTTEVSPGIDGREISFANPPSRSSHSSLDPLLPESIEYHPSTSLDDEDTAVLTSSVISTAGESSTRNLCPLGQRYVVLERRIFTRAAFYYLWQYCTLKKHDDFMVSESTALRIMEIVDFLNRRPLANFNSSRLNITTFQDSRCPRYSWYTRASNCLVVVDILLYIAHCIEVHTVQLTALSEYTVFFLVAENTIRLYEDQSSMVTSSTEAVHAANTASGALVNNLDEDGESKGISAALTCTSEILHLRRQYDNAVVS